MQFLIHDDDDLFVHLLTYTVQRRGHQIGRIHHPSELRRLETPPQVIVLAEPTVQDALIALLLELRTQHDDTLIYVLTEEVTPRTTIQALEAGATDVLKKPMFPLELIVRAESAPAMRRDGSRPFGRLTVGDLEVDLQRAHATKAGRQLPLTRLEFRLLYCLMEHHGRITPTDRLLAFGWDSEESSNSTLKTHMSHLRQKLAEAGGYPVRIAARQMLGYVMEVGIPVEAESQVPRPLVMSDVLGPSGVAGVPSMQRSWRAGD